MDEVHAAGLADPPIAIRYDTGEIAGRENLSAADNATLDAVIAAHKPQDWWDRQTKAKGQREAYAADRQAIDLETRLQTSTPEELDAWIAQIGDWNRARTLFAQICKLLAARLGEPGRIVPMK